MTKESIHSSPEHVAHRRKTIKSFKARANAKLSPIDKFADFLTRSFGAVPFLIFNAIFFSIWITLNIGAFGPEAIIDPFPFSFLTLIVSLEAIFLAIIVLISQNRQARVEELREEVELYINTYAEAEITKMIYLQTLLLEKSGIDLSKDEELKTMLKVLESNEIEKELEKQL